MGQQSDSSGHERRAVRSEHHQDSTHGTGHDHGRYSTFNDHGHGRGENTAQPDFGELLHTFQQTRV